MKIANAVALFQGLRDLRKTAWLLTSFPKSGNTWVRFILANYFLALDGREESCQTFPELNAFLCEFGKGPLRQQWRGEPCGPLVVKTHWRHWFGFRGIPSMLIIRNPGDVMVSYFHYLQDRGWWDGDFSGLVRSPRFGLPAWTAHYRSWRPTASAVIRYEDLKSDPSGVMARALAAVGGEVRPDLLAGAIGKAATENIRRIERRSGDEAGKRPVFIRNAGTRQWQGVFSADDLAYANSVLPVEFHLQ